MKYLSLNVRIQFILVAYCILFVNETALAGKKHMDRFELDWSEVSTREANIISFSYSKGKFRDIDFHAIESDQHWKAMKASDSAALALVEVDSSLTIAELKECARKLRELGAYKKIRFVFKLGAR